MQSKLITAAAILAASVGGVVAAQMPAAAAPGETWTQVNTHRACQQQYGGGVFGASHYLYSPDGLYCYGLSFPFGISWTGSLDKHRIYSYCRAAFGNTADARVGPGWRLPENAWWCVTPS
jgi:hypothetical protein